MKWRNRFFTLVIIAIVSLDCNCAHAQIKTGKLSDKTSSEMARLKGELEKINIKIEQFYSRKEVDSLAALYFNEFTLLPEYKSAIIDKNGLEKFYTDWFHTADNVIYKKSIYKVEKYADYILEIGNFNLSYSGPKKPNSIYIAKYMIMWKRNAKGELNILSEAFGSDKNIGPDDVPYTTVQIKSGFVLEENMVSGKLKADIEEVDRILTKAVEDGDGEARAEGFTDDGMYLPHFGPILEGMAVLRPYMLKTYTPASHLYVKNTYREIFDTGEFVFINGHFKGGWGDPVNGGKFEGNMSNLMKRNEKGKLKMYRQLANNDR